MKNFFITIAIAIAMTSTISSLSAYEKNKLKEEYLDSVRSTKHEIVQLQSDEKLLAMSNFVCDILEGGQSADDAIFAVVFDQKKRNDSTFIYGAIVVKESVEHFCPIYRFQTEAWVK